MDLNGVRDALISQGGVVVMFLAALRLGHKQVWVWGREQKFALEALVAMTKDRDEWRDRCLEAYADARKLATFVRQETKP